MAKESIHSSVKNMPTCPRCNYKTQQLTLFIKHCNRKKICAVSDQGGQEDIDLKELADSLVKERLDKKKHECDICHKRYSTKATLNVHKKKLHPVTTTSTSTTTSEQVIEDGDGIIFGEEDLMVYLDDKNTIMMGLLQDKSMDIEKIFKTLTATIFKDKSIRVKNGHFSIYTDKGWVVQSDMKKVIGIAKQRVNMIMQNPLTMEDDQLEELKNIIGIEKYTALEEWTYRMDVCDQEEEFDENTNAMFLNTLVAF